MVASFETGKRGAIAAAAAANRLPPRGSRFHSGNWRLLTIQPAFKLALRICFPHEEQRVKRIGKWTAS